MWGRQNSNLATIIFIRIDGGMRGLLANKSGSTFPNRPPNISTAPTRKAVHRWKATPKRRIFRGPFWMRIIPSYTGMCWWTVSSYGWSFQTMQTARNLGSSSLKFWNLYYWLVKINQFWNYHLRFVVFLWMEYRKGRLSRRLFKFDDKWSLKVSHVRITQLLESLFHLIFVIVHSEQLLVANRVATSPSWQAQQIANYQIRDTGSLFGPLVID